MEEAKKRRKEVVTRSLGRRRERGRALSKWRTEMKAKGSRGEDFIRPLDMVGWKEKGKSSGRY